MEQFRLLIAIGLSFLIFLVWGHFFGSKEAPQKPAPEQKASEVVRETPYTKGSTPVLTPQIPVAVAEAIPASPVKPARMIEVDAPLYRVSISEEGAVFKSYVLKDFREKVGKNSPLKERHRSNTHHLVCSVGM